MAINLSTVTVSARASANFSQGSVDFSLATGKTLKIETSPNGEEILDLTVPVGKSWDVSISVSINETDA